MSQLNTMFLMMSQLIYLYIFQLRSLAPYDILVEKVVHRNVPVHVLYPSKIPVDVPYEESVPVPIKIYYPLEVPVPYEVAVPVPHKEFVNVEILVCQSLITVMLKFCTN